jgi:hypothetical protein
MSADGDPETRVDVTGVGDLTPTVIGLAITRPGLLLYPLYEIPVFLTGLLAFMMMCFALSLTQLARHLVARHDSSRWRGAGRRSDWTANSFALPRAADLIVRLVLSIVLIWATN